MNCTVMKPSASHLCLSDCLLSVSGLLLLVFFFVRILFPQPIQPIAFPSLASVSLGEDAIAVLLLGPGLL